jgi:hypothetical protein
MTAHKAAFFWSGRFGPAAVLPMEQLLMVPNPFASVPAVVPFSPLFIA